MDPLLERLLRENGLTLSELKIPSQRGVLQMKERFESTAEERFAKWQPRWKKNDGEEIHLSTSLRPRDESKPLVTHIRAKQAIAREDSGDSYDDEDGTTVSDEDEEPVEGKVDHAGPVSDGDEMDEFVEEDGENTEDGEASYHELTGSEEDADGADFSKDSSGDDSTIAKAVDDEYDLD